MDTLTGLATRKDLLAQYERLTAEGVTSARPLALIVANLDHFKPINMDFGILVGDQVLEEVAALLVQNAPARGVVTRIGGDLFALVLRANLSIARECADSLRRKIAGASFTKRIRMTASFGVAAASEAMPFDDLVRNAEACLYAAKAKGRNCVVDSDEFAATAGPAAHDAEIADNENKLRVITDRLARAVQLRSRRITESLKAEVDRDGLTGLYNRRYFDARLAREIDNAHKRSHGFSLILLDLDHFGNVNRCHGYPAGDTALRALGDILRESVRPMDWAARYGGEEFCLVLPDTAAAEAITIAERVRTALASRVMRSHDGREFGITASQGVVELGAGDLFPADLIQRAGDKLREAKNSGRNRVAA